MSWRNSSNVQFVNVNKLESILRSNIPTLIDIIGNTYESFYRKESINPDTYSLKFSDKPSARINALPAYVGKPVDLAGIKWVSSFPSNVENNKQRAAATIILNSYETGYPLAVLDGTLISASRTAASAALSARSLRPTKKSEHLFLYGAGIINRLTVEFLLGDGWDIKNITVLDFSEEAQHSFIQYFSGLDINFLTEEPKEKPDVLIFATSALEPWYDKPIDKDQIVLHISLRDIKPERLLPVDNIVDDVDHALKANTSLHLLEQQLGSRAFSINDYSAILHRKNQEDKGAVVAAFGMGILDVAFGAYIMDEAESSGDINVIDGLLSSTVRW